MGQKILTWCDHCGTKTTALTTYRQLTDSACRTTEIAAAGKFKLELCDNCLIVAQQEFENKRKFTHGPAQST